MLLSGIHNPAAESAGTRGRIPVHPQVPDQSSMAAKTENDAAADGASGKDAVTHAPQLQMNA